MNKKDIAFGTVVEIKENGSMTVKLGSCRALAHIKDGRGLYLDERAKLSFAKEKLSDPVNVGDEIACEWRGSAVGKWTFRSTYLHACQEQEIAEQEIWDARFQQEMMDDWVTDVIIPKAKENNPHLNIPSFPPRQQLDEFHRKGTGIINWLLARPDSTNKMKNEMLEKLAVSVFAKPKSDN